MIDLKKKKSCNPKYLFITLDFYAALPGNWAKRGIQIQLLLKSLRANKFRIALKRY